MAAQRTARIDFKMCGLGRLACLIALLAGASGCDFLVFDDFADEAAIEVLQRPAGVAGSAPYGIAVAGYADRGTSWVVGSAGPNTALALHRVWSPEDGLVIGPPNFDACNDEDDACFPTGAALAGAPGFFPGRGCVLTTSSERSDVVCGSTTITTSGKGATSAAGLSVGDDNDAGFAVALVGRSQVTAPDADNGPVERLYRIDDNATGLTPLDLAPGVLPDGGGLGHAIAAVRLNANEVLFATSSDAGRVVVGVTEPGPRPLDDLTRVIACVDGEAGFGRSLAFGDAVGTSTPDLVIGTDGGAQLFDIATPLGGGAVTTCEASTLPPPVELSCTGEARSDVTLGCEGSDFGRAVAAGNLDGDGKDELFVGAPGAMVDDHAGAGAVFVFDGSGAALDALTHSTPAEDDRVGESLAVVPTGAAFDRDEVVAGAPGARRVLVFFCSGVAGDVPGTEGLGPRCVMAAPGMASSM